MIPTRIPIAILATDPAESQAFADIFTGGLAGMVTLADGEKPLVTLVCPSARREDVKGGPAVVIGEGALETPTRLADIIAVIERTVLDGKSLGAERVHDAWRLQADKMTLYSPEGVAFALTDTEVRLLTCLFDANGTEITRADLLQTVWGYRPGLDTHTVETHIYRLRQKIEHDPANPAFVVTTDNGYRLGDSQS
ncbi:MAG TPA: helix-turn-helix domain-containing protein [Alphaproteobacteria bacterium]